MGLFGGGNSTSSTTNQSSGFSQVSGSALQLQGSDNAVTLSDSGAIAAAENIAGEALNTVQLSGQNQSNTLAQAISGVLSASQGQVQSIAQDAIKWGALALLAYFAFRVFAKK